MTTSLLDLVIAALAVWRVSHMLVQESGPFSVFATLRFYADATWDTCEVQRKTAITNALCCVRCTSIWASVGVLALMKLHLLGYGLVVVIAVSGLAVMLDRISAGR
jgi:hypothetical protein